MSNFLEIYTALSTRLSTLTTTYEKAYPNVEYEPTQGANYLQLSFIPVDSEQADLGTAGRNRQTGIAQIDVVFYGQTGVGDAYTEVDSVSEWFKRGTKLTSNGVEVTITSVEIGPNLNEAGFFQIPVSISYRAYTAN